MTAQLPQLTTERLDLCAPVSSDIVAYRAFYAASDLTEGHYRGGRSDAEVTDLHERDMWHWRKKGFGIFLLRAKGSDRVLGGTGLDHADDWNTHELTWWLMPDARGAGYATEASRAVVAWAYDTLGWNHVQTFMRDANTASHALAQRLGGTKTDRRTFPDGVTRDVYSLPRAVAA